MFCYTSLFHFSLTQESAFLFFPVKEQVVNILNINSYKKSMLHILLGFCFILFFPYTPFKNVEVIFSSKAVQKQARDGVGLLPMVGWPLAFSHNVNKHINQYIKVTFISCNHRLSADTRFNKNYKSILWALIGYKKFILSIVYL